MAEEMAGVSIAPSTWIVGIVGLGAFVRNVTSHWYDCTVGSSVVRETDTMPVVDMSLKILVR